MTKSSRTPPDDNPSLAKKRFVAKQRRGFLKKFRKQSGDARARLPENATSTIPKSELLDGLYPNRRKLCKKTADKEEQATITLRGFDFITNPQETLKMMMSIIEADCKTEGLRIDFRDWFCRDISPYMVLAQVLDETQSPTIGGSYSPALKKVLDATKLAENMTPVEDTKAEINDIWALPVSSCTGGGSNIEAAHVKLAEQTSEMINSWLNEVGFELTEIGEDKLVSMMCELLDNAIIHSKPLTWDGEARIGGFMAKRGLGDGRDGYVCHLSVVSVGASIYESMQHCSEEIREDIKGLVKSHKRGMSLRKHWTKQALWTLYALQDGVTRVDEQKGGKGFMDLIEFFGELGGGDDNTEGTELVIISGDTCIQLTGQKPGKDERGFRRIAFNKANDLHKAPSKDYIWSMKRERFPGTVLSMRFLLNPEYLHKLTKVDNDKSRKKNDRTCP